MVWGEERRDCLNGAGFSRSTITIREGNMPLQIAKKGPA